MSDDILILDEVLVDHLAIPESASYLYKERFTTELLDIDPRQKRRDDESFAGKVWDFVFAYIQEHNEAPTKAVMTDEFSEYEFQDPTVPIAFVLDKFRKRHTHKQLQEIFKAASRKSGENPLEAQEIAYSGLSKLRVEVKSRSNEIDSNDWQQMLKEYQDDVLEGRFNGITMGWPEMTEKLGGYRKGCFYVNVARPKRYKSWLGLASGVDAQWQGVNSVLMNLEMPQKETFGRYYCLATNNSYTRWVHGQWEPQDYRHMEEVMPEINSKATMSILRPDIGKRDVRTMVEEAMFKDAEILYIDQLSFIESPRANGNTSGWEAIKYICEDIKNCAINYDIPIVVAAQFNREAANLNEMADLSKIGLSDSIGQFADMILGVHQTKDLRDIKSFEYGTVDSRGFEPASYYIKANLTNEANFALLGEKDDTPDDPAD